MQSSWPGPLPPGQRGKTIKLIRCARCDGPLYQTKLKGQPRQEDHDQGCEVFIRAMRVMRYVDELKRAASAPSQGGWRSGRQRRKYVLENAKRLTAVACEPDPSAALRDLGNQYEAEGQAREVPADTTRVTEMLMRACRRLAVGEAPPPIVLE